MFLALIPGILLSFSILFGVLYYLGKAPLEILLVGVLFCLFSFIASGLSIYNAWVDTREQDAVNDGSNRRIE